MTTHAYAAHNPTDPLVPFTYQQRPLRPTDVHIAIDYCGVCHTDIHMARNDWGRTSYPIVPGHEIVGHVTAIGNAVTRYAIGDRVGVGCMVGSCQTCSACEADLEQYCDGGMTMTYGSPDPYNPGHTTYGGYGDSITVDESFVLSVSEKLDAKAVAPLLCAGITTYSPLKHWQVGPNQKVGIIGLGGLGHMGIKFAVALGAHVVMITTSASKQADAERLGAHDCIVLNQDDNTEILAHHANSFDFLLDTIPVAHDINAYLGLLKRDKTLVTVGATPLEVHSSGVIFGRKRVAGSLIGGIQETQDMLDFCAQHAIVSDIELITRSEINTAYDRILKSTVKYRFVIDIKNSR